MQTAKLTNNPSINSLKVAAITYTEEELIQALYQKNQMAFSYLYDMYAPALTAVVMKMINNKQLCEDVLQDIFIKIWNNIDKYDCNKGRLYTWMITITRNVVLDVVRSKEFKIQKNTTNETAFFRIDNQDCEFKKFDTVKVKTQLLALSKEHLKLIDLIYFNGFSQVEIATMTGTPLGTVKTRIRAAINHLRKLMQENPTSLSYSFE